MAAMRLGPQDGRQIRCVKSSAQNEVRKIRTGAEAADAMDRM
jgi:hypothetical protein